MGLNFPSDRDEQDEDVDVEESIFTHNRDFSEGVKQVGIRVGQATVVVALDGSGDANNLQEAINMLPSTGGVIYMKEGTYFVPTQITITKSNVAIIGAGAATILRETTNNIVMLYATGKNNLKIEGLYFDGNGYGNGYGIRLTNCTLSKIISCWFYDTGDEAIYVDGTTTEKNIIALNHIIQCDRGIKIYRNQNIIANNVINLAGGTARYSGLDVDATSGNTGQYNIIVGNAITNCANGMIIRSYQYRNTITGNVIESDSGGVGLYLETVATRNVAIGNIIQAPSGTPTLDNGVINILANNVTE